MNSHLYKKIGATLLIAVFFVGQVSKVYAIPVELTFDGPKLTQQLGSIAALAASSPIVGEAVNSATQAIGVCGSAQLDVILSPLENALDVFGVITNAKIEALKKISQTDIATSKVLSESQKNIATICIQLAQEISKATSELAKLAPAATQTDAPILVLIQVSEIAQNLITNVDTKLALVKQEQQIIKAQKQLEEQKKARQLIQFDQILKKITERIKLALTEKIKSTILDTLQNSGAPRWITNWSTRYANKYLNAYQQAYQEARLEEVQRNQFIQQRVANLPTYSSTGLGVGNPSFVPNDVLNAIQKGPLAKFRKDLIKYGMPTSNALRPGLVANEIAKNEVEAQKQEDIATSGYKSDGECVDIKSGSANAANSINTGGADSRYGGSNPFGLDTNNLFKRFASNANVLSPEIYSRVAEENIFRKDNQEAPSILQQNVYRQDAINAQSEFLACSSIKDQIACVAPRCTWIVKTSGDNFANMSKELMGIDIKQMLNNTIEEWVNSFLDNSILCKISGTKCGKTANIGDIAKQQLLGQLSKFGDSLNEDNPAKYLIAQIVEQGGSLDGVFGSSRQSQEARDQLSQYGNSLPDGDPARETINQIVSAENNSGGGDGTLSGISIGGNTDRTSGKIDCSVFEGSAKTDCETAAGLFDSGKDLQKQMIDESIKNLDMPGRLSRAAENLNTISTKLNQTKTIYEDIAKCPTDNQQLAKDTIPLIEEMIDDSLVTQEMVQNVGDSIDQFKNSSPEKLETLMENESQFLDSIDKTMTEIENTNIPKYFTSIRMWLSQIVKFNTALRIEVEGIATTIPANINVTNGCQQSPFTTDTSGTLFVQTLTQKEYTLQDFFGAWGRTFNQTQLFNLPHVDAFRELTLYVNNATSTEFQALKLQGNQNILIKYTTKPAGTCIDGKLIDGSPCPVEQQACRTDILNPPSCIRQTGQNCVLLDNPTPSRTGSQALFCSY